MSFPNLASNFAFTIPTTTSAGSNVYAYFDQITGGWSPGVVVTQEPPKQTKDLPPLAWLDRRIDEIRYKL